MSHPSADVQGINQSLLEYAADSLVCAQRHTEAERKALGDAVIDAISAFRPGNPLETVLASEVIGFHLSIMDGFREINSLPMTRTESARARMVAVAQTKMVLALVRELRLTRKAAEVQVEPTEAAEVMEGDAAFQANLAEFRSGYTQALAMLEQARTLDPETSDRAKAALERAAGPALAALAPTLAAPNVTVIPGPAGQTTGGQATGGQATSGQTAGGQATGSRAHRRAVMKRQGAFRKAS